MDSALIISSTEKSISILAELLDQANIPNIATISTGGEARRLLIENNYDICIVNAPLRDEYGLSLAQNISAKGISEVILLISAESFEEVSAKAENNGILTVSKPMNRLLFWSALKLAQSTHNRMKMFEKENKKLLQKIEDIRLIDRAKCILISYLSMTEKEAHRYIEKQAMDMRITKRAVAEDILKTYES